MVERRQEDVIGGMDMETTITDRREQLLMEVNNKISYSKFSTPEDVNADDLDTELEMLENELDDENVVYSATNTNNTDVQRRCLRIM